MRLLIPIIVLTVVGGLKNGTAADAETLGLADDDPFWVLQAGLEGDHEGGYVVNGGVSYLYSEQTMAALSFGYADSSADLSDLEASYASALFDHSFGPVGGSLSVGWTSDADIVDRYRYGGSIYFQTGGFRLEVIGEGWRSEFEPFEFSRLIGREPPALPLLLTGTASCSLDNTAFGGHLSYGHDAWRIYGGVTDYEYSDADCTISAALGDIDLRNPPDGLVDSSPAFFQRLAAVTASWIGNSDVATSRFGNNNAAFLDYSLSAGLSWQLDNKNLALDYYHSEEIFRGLTANTLIASLLFPVGLRTDWELRVGATDHEQSGLVVFVGATVFWYVGGGS